MKLSHHTPRSLPQLAFSFIQDQYKFIYRAISDYVDLYRSKDEEYDYSVPVNAVLANGKK